MRHPHPWLAAVGRVNVWLAVAALTVAVGLFLYRPEEHMSYWGYANYRWRFIDSSWQASLFLREDAAAVVHTLAPPLAWLAAGWLLRAAAAGRLGAGARGGPARLLAKVGLVWAAAAAGMAGYTWAAPTSGMSNGPSFARRVGMTADTGMLVTITRDVNGRPGGFGESLLPAEYDVTTNTRTDRSPWARAAVAVACDARALAGLVWPPAVLFCLCGAVVAVTGRAAEGKP